MSEFTNHNGILVHPEIYTYDYQGNTVDHVLPDDPDFPAAVEALAKLVPEPFEWEWGGWSYDYQNGVVTRYSPSQSGLLDHESTAAFNAGRRYEQERGHADE